jgi:hypothetical protein
VIKKQNVKPISEPENNQQDDSIDKPVKKSPLKRSSRKTVTEQMEELENQDHNDEAEPEKVVVKKKVVVRQKKAVKKSD